MQAGLFPLAVVGIAASVIGAYYYLKVIKTMYFDAPSDELARGGDMVDYALITVAALLMSPLGYLLIVPLSAATTKAAGALF